MIAELAVAGSETARVLMVQKVVAIIIRTCGGLAARSTGLSLACGLTVVTWLKTFYGSIICLRAKKIFKAILSGI